MSGNKKNHNLFCFIGWVAKLLLPDFLVGEPNLIDNIQILMTQKRFKPIRVTFMIWIFFLCVILGYGYYWLEYVVPQTSELNVIHTVEQPILVSAESGQRTLFDHLYEDHFVFFASIFFAGIFGISILIHLLFTCWMHNFNTEIQKTKRKKSDRARK